MLSARLFRRNDRRFWDLLPQRFPSRRYFASSFLRCRKNDSDQCDESGYSSSDGCIKMTILGAAGRVGRTLSLLLKTSPLVDQLCLFDVNRSVKGFCVDLSHIDTKCEVSYVCGMSNIQEALDGPDVVMIAAGFPSSPQISAKTLFTKNAPIVAGLSEACARFCPNACIVLITSPINSLLPVAGEVYELVTGENPSEKLFGLTTLDVVRANTFTAEAIRHDPREVIVPVIGGTSEETIVPVISQMKPCCKIKHEEVVALTECVKQAEGSLADCQNCGARGSSSLSTAYAAFRFSSSLVSALKGGTDVVECAYVRSNILPELEYLASPLKLGSHGVEYNYGYPKLSEHEVYLMERAALALQKDIKMGKAYVIEQRGNHYRERCRKTEADYEVKLMERGAIALKSDIEMGKLFVIENKESILRSLSKGLESENDLMCCKIYDITEISEPMELVSFGRRHSPNRKGKESKNTVKCEESDISIEYSAVFPNIVRSVIGDGTASPSVCQNTDYRKKANEMFDQCLWKAGSGAEKRIRRLFYIQSQNFRTESCRCPSVMFNSNSSGEQEGCKEKASDLMKVEEATADKPIRFSSLEDTKQKIISDAPVHENTEELNVDSDERLEPCPNEGRKRIGMNPHRTRRGRTEKKRMSKNREERLMRRLNRREGLIEEICELRRRNRELVAKLSELEWAPLRDVKACTEERIERDKSPGGLTKIIDGTVSYVQRLWDKLAGLFPPEEAPKKRAVCSSYGVYMPKPRCSPRITKIHQGQYGERNREYTNETLEELLKDVRFPFLANLLRSNAEADGRGGRKYI